MERFVSEKERGCPMDNLFHVPEAGLEPAQPLWPKDFKSFVSTISPFGQPGSRIPA